MGLCGEYVIARYRKTLRLWHFRGAFSEIDHAAALPGNAKLPHSVTTKSKSDGVRKKQTDGTVRVLEKAISMWRTDAKSVANDER